MKIYQATYWYCAEKPYGVGRTAHERHSYIVEGWRGEIIEGLDDRQMVYTGVCASKEECKAELIGHLKRLGHHGVLKTA